MNKLPQAEGIKVRITLRNTKGIDIGYIDNIKQVHNLLPHRDAGQYEDNFINPITKKSADEEIPASIITYEGNRYEIKAIHTKFVEMSIPDGFNSNPNGYNFQLFYIVEPIK